MTSMRRQNNVRRHINHVVNRLTINLSHISRKIAPRHVTVRQGFFTKTTVDAAKEFFSGCCFGKRGDPQQFAYVIRHLLISAIYIDGTVIPPRNTTVSGGMTVPTTLFKFNKSQNNFLF